MNTIVILESNEDFVSRLESLLSDGGLMVNRAASSAEAQAAVERRGVTVIVTGPSIALDDAARIAEHALRAETGAAVVAVLPSVDTDLMRRAMRSGCHDVLSAGDQTWSEVAESIRAAHASVLERSGAEAGIAPVRCGRVVAVMGTKGGVDKSVIATNLATALAGAGESVVLVDLDLMSGDDGIMMKLEPVRTISDAVAVADRLDAELLSGFLTPHSSGLRVLLAPKSADEAEVVTASRVARILALLREIADIIIVDTPSAWTEATLAAADASDSILAVTGMELTSIKDTTAMLARLVQLGRGNGTVKVVLNRADSKVLVEEKDVERALGRSIVSRVPSDRSVPRSVNKGVPVVMESPRSGVSRAVLQLARSVSTNGVRS